MKAYTIDYREIVAAKKERLARRIAEEHRREEALGCLIEVISIWGLVLVVASMTYICLWVAK